MLNPEPATQPSTLTVESRADTEAAMAKVAGSRPAVDLARDAIQVCGAYGFVRDVKGSNAQMPLAAIYRDAKIGEICEEGEQSPEVDHRPADLRARTGRVMSHPAPQPLVR